MHERTPSATPTSVAVVDRTEPTTAPPTAPAAPSTVRQIPTRRVSFDETLARLPKHFAEDGDLLLSHIFAAMSAFFPDGEDFFVRSVRRFRSQITDPELTAQVAGFIGQEAVHGRQHRAFNQRLGELGYPTPVFERLTKRSLAIRERVFTAKANLAATAALEHFTATFAELLLTDEETRLAPGDAGVRDLLLWHALEESEHKSVAFDVYRAVGGSERTRIITMKGIRIGFILALTVQTAVSVAGDSATYEKGRLRASAKRLRSSPALRREIWDRLREYDRPGFHPDDRDTDELVARWRDELFGADGSLNHRLGRSGAAA
jgi:predicted metal-dependent hydrolase